MTQLKRRIWLGCKGLFLFMLLILSSCRPDDPEFKVKVETGALLEVGSSSCQVEGEVVSVGESGISSHGFVWSEQREPSIESGMKHDLGEIYFPGTFSYTISGLTATTTYYVRAYAVGGGKVSYGSEKSFTTRELTVPSLVTFSVYDYGATGGFSGGNITDNGGGEVHASGVCWSTNRFPDLSDAHTNEGSGHASFESYIHDLDPYTVYHVRAYATNDAGTGYGQEVAFRTNWDNAPLVDWDGNEYPTVQIGDQVWTAMSLRSAHYADGTPVGLVEDPNAWSTLEADAAAYCFYENNDQQAEPFGALYTWSAAVNEAAGGLGTEKYIQGVCPDGWHIPEDDEWKMLEMELGMSQLTAGEDQWRGWDEGGKLKMSGTAFWDLPNEMATNESGFTGIPSGMRNSDGAFTTRGQYAVFWTATGGEASDAWVRGLHTQRGDIKRVKEYRGNGYSVRCIKDE
jgi:uncharacterized protein (TIGR02145 family)